MAKASGGTGHRICSLCQEDGISNTAITWCIDCETFLCSDCNKAHGRIKSSKNHNITSVESYNELPSFITETKNHCQEHNKRLEVYCSFHSEVCCLDCITSTHSDCKGFRKIEDVLSEFKSSASVFHAETYLNDLSANFEKVTTHLTKQLASIRSQKTNGVQNIESTKRSLVDHLDKIAKCLVNDVELKYSDLKSKIENKIIEIGRQKSKLDQAKREFSKMKEFATEIQMYEGIKVIEKTTNEKMQYLEELERKGGMNETRLEIKLSPFLNSIISDLVCFGDTSVFSSTSSSVVLNLNKGEQVNILGGSSNKNINEIRPKLLKTIQILDGKNLNVTGCRILPDGQMIFVEQVRKCLVLYNKDGDFLKTVPTFANVPYDVTFVKDNVVAVTTYNDKRVNFVNIDENKIINSCSVQHSCYGIVKHNDTIMTNTAGAKVIISLDPNGKIKSSIQINSNSTNIASFENQLYVSEWRNNKVSCYKDTGDLLWTHQLDTDCHPRGLSLDRYGNIYVACVQSNKVIIISEDGNTHSTILNESNGLQSPFGLHIDNKMSKLLVSNQNEGSAYLFQI